MALSDLPTHLTSSEKRDVFATDSGWEKLAGGNSNPNAQREVLTAINQLATTLGPVVVKSINWKAGSGAYTKVAGGTIGLEVVFSEGVTGINNLTVPVTNETDAARSLTLDFSTVTDNIATFDITIPANSASLDVADVIGISSTDVLSLNGDTVLGFGGGSSDLDIASLDAGLFPTGITIG
tara:strand:- start:61 stop:603 length:543 start_codon:yes stop_codon:yes gene_type:complete